MSEHIQIRKDVPSGTIVINRPECRNALTPRTITELQTALQDLHGEKQVRGIILTGGEGAFSSGTDLRHLHEQMQCPDPETFWEDEMPEVVALLELMLRFPKPIVAAVSGVAAGTGLALALACDYVIAEPQARFAIPESHRGLLPGLSVPLLMRRCSIGFTNKLAFTGQPVDAELALQETMIDEVVKADLLWARANQMVTEFSRGAPSSHQLARQLINDTISEDLFVQLSIGAANTAAARSTDAAKKGVEAFVNKMPVDWNS